MKAPYIADVIAKLADESDAEWRAKAKPEFEAPVFEPGQVDPDVWAVAQQMREFDYQRMLDRIAPDRFDYQDQGADA
ncbi:hypothetical protein [Actinomadura hibisca]|uniref:hypothetical protein n=1 Tax=Actinomadura hibisca TaxID=68565 RepID=UPI000836F2EA|nr:hypothetical protein [Actinomadura hibisca]